MTRLTEKISDGSYKLNDREIIIEKLGKMEDFIEFVLYNTEESSGTYLIIKKKLEEFGLL